MGARKLSHHFPFLQGYKEINSVHTGLPNRHESSNEYRYGFNGYEKDDEVSGEGNSLNSFFRQYDPRLGRFKSTDPMSNKFPWQSPYVGFDNNPILYPDPSGGETEDWYENKETGEYKWFAGSGSQEGYEHLGEYLVTTDKVTNSLTIYYQNEWTDVVDLNSELGKKFSVVAFEGGFIDQSIKPNRGVEFDASCCKNGVSRETLYGLLIISASIENRLASSNYDKNNTDKYSDLFVYSQYNVIVGDWVHRLTEREFDNWSKAYGKGNVMQYLGDVYTASQGDAVYTLFRNYNFVNSDRIFAYAHNNPSPSSQIWKGYGLNYDRSKTLINVISTGDHIQRDLVWYNYMKNQPHPVSLKDFGFKFNIYEYLRLNLYGKKNYNH